MGQSKTKLSIILCGLDNSGKTTILNQMKSPEERSTNTAATIGYNVDTFTKGKVKFTAFDMGGAKKFRDLWESYYANVNGIVFVVDSSDVLRMCVVKDEIQLMLEHPDIKNTKVPVLFFANKSDRKEVKTPAEITQMLELSDILGDRPFNIFASNALAGTGLDEGMSWLEGVMLQQVKESGKKK